MYNSNKSKNLKIANRKTLGVRKKYSLSDPTLKTLQIQILSDLPTNTVETYQNLLIPTERFHYCSINQMPDKWIDAIQPVLESLYGHLASFITTNHTARYRGYRRGALPTVAVRGVGCQRFTAYSMRGRVAIVSEGNALRCTAGGQ
jgi:hypothetical protein